MTYLVTWWRWDGRAAGPGVFRTVVQRWVWWLTSSLLSYLQWPSPQPTLRLADMPLAPVVYRIDDIVYDHVYPQVFLVLPLRNTPHISGPAIVIARYHFCRITCHCLEPYGNDAVLNSCFHKSIWPAAYDTYSVLWLLRSEHSVYGILQIIYGTFYVIMRSSVNLLMCTLSLGVKLSETIDT